MSEENGFIYIFTNPAFPQFVKIGYTKNINQRLVELNSKTCLPYGFRVFAYYEVTVRNSDKMVHTIIDMLNPKLRCIDYNADTNIQSKREFFSMSADDAYLLLESIARITDTEDRLHKGRPTEQEKKNEDAANEAIEKTNRRSRFKFTEIGIPIGSTLRYVDDDSITCEVVSDTKVKYKGEITSISAITSQIKGGSGQYNGAIFFTYEGKLVCDMREEHDKELESI